MCDENQGMCKFCISANLSSCGKEYTDYCDAKYILLLQIVSKEDDVFVTSDTTVFCCHYQRHIQAYTAQ